MTNAASFSNAYVSRKNVVTDEKIGEQRSRLLRIFPQNHEVIRHRRRPLHLHSARDASANGRFIITREVVSRADAQM